ncbi:outer membrane protein assembly factor BamE [Zophobihabitans entericus]|uniref:Outer membrane protein assembly factor BamE n=1 Tax=Zophobihabitans entericus TaxID=1635327 RepID=A0A6G9IAK5_9GAMM|nr:outer membrane protein assembly factor BamE [Zophobihabitans entericus]QIQ20754.1 outer membrane protein assembly factor BamE [Zophobihabitans entericus]
MSFKKSILAAITVSVLLSGCSFVDRWVYRPDINQGNYITAEDAAKLKVGQTKEQVKFILGSPMLTSVFGDNIWYYVFREQPHHGYISQLTYTLTFDGQNRLTDIQTSEMGDQSDAQSEGEDD